MATALGSVAPSIDAYTYVQVVDKATTDSIKDSTTHTTTYAIWGIHGAEPVGYSNGFSFYTHFAELTKAAGWDSSKKKYTKDGDAAAYFREKILKAIDAKHFAYLLKAAVLLDNSALTALVLEATPKIAGTSLSLDGARVVAIANEHANVIVEIFLRKHFNIPAPMRSPPASPTTVKSLPKTPQTLAAAFAKLDDSDVARRSQLLGEFAGLPVDFKNRVYGALYKIKPPTSDQQHVLNYGEQAFLHFEGLSSTGQEKSKAILSVLGASAKK